MDQAKKDLCIERLKQLEKGLEYLKQSVKDTCHALSNKEVVNDKLVHLVKQYHEIVAGLDPLLEQAKTSLEEGNSENLYQVARKINMTCQMMHQDAMEIISGQVPKKSDMH